MTWQSKKPILVAFCALLLAIGILWLLAVQVSKSYNTEISRIQSETENIGIAAEQELIGKLELIKIKQSNTAEKIQPILDNDKLTTNDTEKLKTVLEHFLTQVKDSLAVGIINTNHENLSSASTDDQDLLSASIFLPSKKDAVEMFSANGRSNIHISQRIDPTSEESASILSVINADQLIKKFSILKNNKQASIFLFDKDIKPLKQNLEKININNHLAAFQSFIQSNQQSSSFTINSKTQSTQINLRRVGDSALYIAIFNQNESNLSTWKNNTIFYIIGCILILGFLLQILYSLARAKRMNQTLFLKETKLSTSETRFRQMIEAMPIGLILARRQDNLIVYINKPAAKILDMPQASALSKRAFSVYSNEMDFTSQINHVFESKTSQSIECILKKNTGEPFWANISISMVDVADTQTLLIGIVDISEQKKLEADLKHQATIDHLSGLYNRAHFINSSNKEIQRIQRHKNNASLLMLDIDHFKRVNDNHGHDAGDLVIQIIALTCQETLRDIDIVGRLGGEEFAALLPETSAHEALNVAERLRIAIEKRAIKLKSGQIINITSSIGVTEVTPNDAIIDIALKRADLAMYSSKNNGRNQVQYFDTTQE
nr:sensor domain-containing diguanylate cyclase [uncultured Deefgea sp.]